MDRLEDVLTFWLETCTPQQWYEQTDALDAQITEKFGETWEMAHAGALEHWGLSPRGALAYLIVTDQFARNMFRGSGKAFATDKKARAMAKKAVEKGYDLRIEEPARQFFYMPLEHSECLADQDRAVRLIAKRMESEQALLHAKVHREIIRSFGRFPYRNAALGRTDTEQETAFMTSGGYGSFVRALSAEAA